MAELLETLIKLKKSDEYPLHMPGHKRNMSGNYLENAFNIDITEIEGYDNLYEANGILLDAMEHTAKVFGADRSYYLVNGSTVGILTAISAVTKRKDKILIARNCHKSVYHAIELQELEVSYVYPKYMDEWDFSGEIDPNDIKLCLQREKNIAAVVLTSPTYEGIASDIETIAKIVHAYNIPLIVDEAHGAHFSFHERFPKSAVLQGADIIVQSLHKTLPCFTQTALLHVMGRHVEREKIEKYLTIYQTSSPSYLLMAGIDSCTSMLEKNGSKLWDDFFINRDNFIKNSYNWSHIKVYNKDKGFDPCKLIISVKNTNINGRELQRILLKRYHLQIEMAAESYIVAIITLSDTKECFERLGRALTEIDNQIHAMQRSTPRKMAYFNIESRYTIARTSQMKYTEMLLKDTQGKIAFDFINLYPPGIPILVPGEVITEDIIKNLIMYEKEKLYLQGVQNNKIRVVEEMDN